MEDQVICFYEERTDSLIKSIKYPFEKRYVDYYGHYHNQVQTGQ